MLKSTHRPHGQQESGPPLAPGWTEHKAPTGHSYYYSAALKQSTYTRPSATSGYTDAQTQNGFYSEAPQSVAPQPYPGYDPTFFPHGFAGGFPHPGTGGNHHSNAGQGIAQFAGMGRGRGNFRGGRGFQDRRRRPRFEDRPTSKAALPGHEPWLLVKTRFGRRFVHNLESGKSLWKIPEDLTSAVEEVDQQDKLKAKGTAAGSGEPKVEGDGAATGDGPAQDSGSERPSAGKDDERVDNEGSEEEYEEVTDEGEEDDEDEETAIKRLKLDNEAPGQPQEFNEDDIAFQLAAMGKSYGLEPGEFGNEEDGEEWEEGAEGLPLTEADSAALFRDMLDDFGINPYSTWDKIIEEGRIIEDDRYTVLPNMKARKETFGEWSRQKIQQLKELRKGVEKQDPRVPYLAFLQNHATPKLYWPEFKRKFKKEPDLRDSKLPEKEREKLYRDHISHLKMPESSLKSDFSKLLKTLPASVLNQSTSVSNLPNALLTDVRYISLAPNVRDPLLEAYLSTLEPAPEGADQSTTEEALKRKEERERREKALAEREKRVAADKQRQNRALQAGRGRLHEEEEELSRAMQVGKEGLRAQLGGADAA